MKISQWKNILGPIPESTQKSMYQALRTLPARKKMGQRKGWVAASSLVAAIALLFALTPITQMIQNAWYGTVDTVESHSPTAQVKSITFAATSSKTAQPPSIIKDGVTFKLDQIYYDDNHVYSYCTMQGDSLDANDVKNYTPTSSEREAYRNRTGDTLPEGKFEHSSYYSKMTIAVDGFSIETPPLYTGSNNSAGKGNLSILTQNAFRIKSKKPDTLTGTATIILQHRLQDDDQLYTLDEIIVKLPFTANKISKTQTATLQLEDFEVSIENAIYDDLNLHADCYVSKEGGMRMSSYQATQEERDVIMQNYNVNIPDHTPAFVSYQVEARFSSDEINIGFPDSFPMNARVDDLGISKYSTVCGNLFGQTLPNDAKAMMHITLTKRLLYNNKWYAFESVNGVLPFTAKKQEVTSIVQGKPIVINQEKQKAKVDVVQTGDEIQIRIFFYNMTDTKSLPPYDLYFAGNHLLRPKSTDWLLTEDASVYVMRYNMLPSSVYVLKPRSSFLKNFTPEQIPKDITVDIIKDYGMKIYIQTSGHMTEEDLIDLKIHAINNYNNK